MRGQWVIRSEEDGGGLTCQGQDSGFYSEQAESLEGFKQVF